MRTVNYDPSIFRRWHDGPVIVVDAMCVGSAIDTGFCTYIVAVNDEAIFNLLNTIERPFAGTIYIFASDEFWLEMLIDDLDIVRVML